MQAWLALRLRTCARTECVWHVLTSDAPVHVPADARKSRSALARDWSGSRARARARTGQAVLQRTGTGPTDRRSGPGGSSSRYIAPIFSRLAQSALPSSLVQTGLAGPACAALAEHEPPPEVHAQVPVRLSSPILSASESLPGPRAEKRKNCLLYTSPSPRDS